MWDNFSYPHFVDNFTALTIATRHFRITVMNERKSMLHVLHIADLHIGVENYGHFDAMRGMHTRLIDFLARFDQAVDIGLAAGVDVVLIAGDMFKTRNPPPRLQREFADGFAVCTRIISQC
jgi:metallophosphoesterase superfamily enzyme